MTNYDKVMRRTKLTEVVDIAKICLSHLLSRVFGGEETEQKTHRRGKIRVIII
jgi:hypothetical protein